MKINLKLLLGVSGLLLAVFGLSTTLYGAWEFAWTLFSNNLIAHPIWSGLLGKGFLHHYIWGAPVGYFGIFLMAVALCMKRERRRN